ncbi:hypothetical protein M9458_003012, partial [Cirrhinus mrigala]
MAETQRLVPSGNHGYIRNLRRSPSGTRAASKCYGNEMPTPPDFKSLPSVEEHSWGERKRARSGTSP